MQEKKKKKWCTPIVVVLHGLVKDDACTCLDQLYLCAWVGSQPTNKTEQVRQRRGALDWCGCGDPHPPHRTCTLPISPSSLLWWWGCSSTPLHSTPRQQARLGLSSSSSSSRFYFVSLSLFILYSPPAPIPHSLPTHSHSPSLCRLPLLCCLPSFLPSIYPRRLCAASVFLLQLAKGRRPAATRTTLLALLCSCVFFPGCG